MDPSALTYEPYFNLREKPFSLAADPRFFFTGVGHGIAFDALAAGIRRREGILVLTGEVGTGKTTLCRAVLQSLDRKTFAAYVSDPFLSREDLLKTLLVDFGVVSDEEVRRGALRGTTRADLSYPLYEFLASLVPLKAFAVVMIDEAQNLTPELLEEVRILSDLERGQKLLEVFLIGQPELGTRLSEEALRPLSQRVTIKCDLPPLTRGEIGLYIAHRLAVAGNDGRVRFTDAAVAEIHAASAGIPRVVNILCDRALTHAANRQTSVVDVDSVKDGPIDPTVSVPSSLPSAPPLALVHSQEERAPQPQAPAMESGKETEHPAPDSLVEMLSAVGTAPEAPAVPAPLAPEPKFWSSTAEDRHLSPPADAAREGGRKAMLAAVAVFVVIAAFAGYRYWSAAPASAPAAAATPTAPTASVPTAPAARNSAAPETTRPPVSESPKTATPPDRSAAAPAGNTRYALLMATFQGDERTAKSLQELRDAGFKAFRVEAALRDGGTAQVVYVGPYTDRAEAERDLERTRSVPGYDGARIVTLRPAPQP